MNWETAFKLTQEALQDDLTYNLAIAFTQEHDGDKTIEIVADQYQQAANGVEDFDLSVEQYLFERLDDENVNMKSADFFESEKEATENGFYWEDEIDRWLKLDVNK